MGIVFEAIGKPDGGGGGGVGATAAEAGTGAGTGAGAGAGAGADAGAGAGAGDGVGTGEGEKKSSILCDSFGSTLAPVASMLGTAVPSISTRETASAVSGSALVFLL